MMRNKATLILILILAGLLAAAVLATTTVTVTGNFEGIYLLRGKPGKLWEVKDDFFLNEETRFIAGVDFDDMRNFLSRSFGSAEHREPSLSFAWNAELGDGYIRNHLRDGKLLVTNFSRFVDDDGRYARGLFVGGGLPANIRGTMEQKNETGMAYYDGRNWRHLWCNVNEAIFSLQHFSPLPPSTWRFLGSEVVRHDPTDLMLRSVHEVPVDGIPLRIDRYAHFHAGEHYFILSIYITNIGNRPVSYTYSYGDEPWVGNYGSAKGNVGWTADGLQPYVGKLDTNRTHYAGIFDYGNEAAGERHEYSGTANFIEWFGDERPMAYFTNGPYESPRTDGRKVPLAGNARFFGLHWGPRVLRPDETASYVLAIGMADRDPRTGFPVKPLVDLKSFP